jgi:P27 family predicted phage terminase small subunit
MTGEPNQRPRAVARPGRLNVDELPTLAGELAPPAWLSPAARAYFAMIVADLAPAAVEMIDRHAVAMYAEALHDFVTARDAVRAEPYLVDDHGQRRRNPAAIVREAAASRLGRWSRGLGMTPAARARMTHTRVIERVAAPAERLFTPVPVPSW